VELEMVRVLVSALAEE
jgi:hypothetical protein